MTTADTFTLNIRLGGDAMQTGSDVAEQLHRAADYLGEYYDALSADTAQSLYDSNGNRVGEWRATVTERQESADEIAAAEHGPAISGQHDALPMSEWAESRRHLMTPQTIAANHALHVSDTAAALRAALEAFQSPHETGRETLRDARTVARQAEALLAAIGEAE